MASRLARRSRERINTKAKQTHIYRAVSLSRILGRCTSTYSAEAEADTLVNYSYNVSDFLFNLLFKIELRHWWLAVHATRCLSSPAINLRTKYTWNQ